MTPYSRVLTSLMATVSVSAFSTASAQEVESSEIIVTAQHKSERIQDVPISIAVVGGEELEEMAISAPVDVLSLIPNVSAQLPTSGTGFPIFNIRGVTLLDFTDTNEASVAIYVDGVYLGSPAIQNGQLFDIDRVEVLKGPQGTLWGRNATGGLIQFLTRRPTADFEGYVTASYGSYDYYKIEGAVSGPISDSVRARLAGFVNGRDGWQKNTFAGGGKDFGDIDTNVGARLTLEFDLADDALLTLGGHYGNYRGETDQRGFFGKGDPVTGAICSIERILASECIDYSTGHSDPNGDPTRVASDLASAPIRNENYGGWARLEWALSDNITLTSITSADTVSKYQVLDADVSPAPLYELYFTIDHDQFSQEIRIGGETSKLDWMIGGYYYSDDRFFTVGFPQLGGYGSFADQEISTYAVFGQVTYAITPAINITGGLRYTDDSRDLNEIAAVVGGVPGTRDGFQLYNTSRSIDENKVTWRVAVDGRIDDDNLVYASVSTGFKSGAFNALYPGAQTNVTIAAPESTTSYEVGLKGASRFGTVMYNLAAFYTDYEDVQAAGTIVIDGTPQSALSTVADATIWGLEADISARLLDGLTASLAAGYLDAEYNAPASALFNGIPIDGKRPVMTPEFSLSGKLRYEHDLSDGGKLHLATDVSWNDKVYFGPENHETEAMDAYALVNLHAGWTSSNADWRVTGHVRNLTDKRYFTHAVDGNAAAPFQTAFTLGMPRTWTIEVTRAF